MASWLDAVLLGQTELQSLITSTVFSTSQYQIAYIASLDKHWSKNLTTLLQKLVKLNFFAWTKKEWCLLSGKFTIMSAKGSSTYVKFAAIKIRCNHRFLFNILQYYYWVKDGLTVLTNGPKSKVTYDFILWSLQSFVTLFPGPQTLQVDEFT